MIEYTERKMFDICDYTFMVKHGLKNQIYINSFIFFVQYYYIILI